jgi:hypothetical protein
VTHEYFSDRVAGPRPRVEEEISPNAWAGLVSLVLRGLEEPLFAEFFPLQCPDGRGVYACDERVFRLALVADIPDLNWPLREDEVPPTLVALDLVEFLHANASEPTELDFHSFYAHSHLTFDHVSGQRQLRERVNRMFARNGLAYELSEAGSVVRLTSAPVAELLRYALPSTQDPVFDELLERARSKFTSPDPAVRREALEHVWDAFERAKTILDPDKQRGAAALLAASARSSADEAALNDEFKALTRIGNEFRIRHHETRVTEIDSSLVDWLFTRMIAVLHRVHPSLA